MRRRDFLTHVSAAATAAHCPGIAHALAQNVNPAPAPKPYTGPNVILIRFGGGVRRQETIADHTYAPYLKHVLAPSGTFYPRMEIAADPGIQTSHGEGTLNLLTGIYDKYEDVQKQPFRTRFEPRVPTLFEAFRKTYDVPPHQAIIVNGEDRIDEEFYTFSNHLHYGVNFRSTVLSLYRFKVWKLREQLAAGSLAEPALTEARKELDKLEKLDHRASAGAFRSNTLDAFWAKWAAYYGKDGLVNPRGDRLLAELAIWAMKELQPRLMMVNFNDPDYVHWGVKNHYTRGIAIVDESLRRIHEAAAALPFYHDQTVFVVAPDCSRDANPLLSVPYQHHSGSRSAREIFAVIAGPGIDRGRTVDHVTQQIAVAPTIAALMQFPMPLAQGDVLQEAFA
jgi:hypothetical protein